ncbi:hypothetical protein [Methylobacterium sp. Leaf118]|uniref:hypothetical protein n=1 Tax=Methylobacterium sp. Leaf118 TaxID=2876562 RepID=UPI001E5F2B7F|nr:hypothetical protein [Methylobacterium sp. Leaf118]
MSTENTGRVPPAPGWSASPESSGLGPAGDHPSRGAAPSVRWHDQTVLHGEGRKGNCMQAAVAGLLGLPMRDVPNFVERPDGKAHLGLINFAQSHGFDLVRDDGAKSFDGLYLACGPTDRGIHHMVVMRDGALYHDPHPSRSGLLSIDFVYTLLPLDPAIHVAACDGAQRLRPLARKASEGPWKSESFDTADGYGACESSQLVGPHGKVVLDALNSGVACMAEESDEDGRRRWDEQGEADAAYVEALDAFGRRLMSFTAPNSQEKHHG